MQGNLFDKLDEYSPPPKNAPPLPQRALPAEPEILPPSPRPKVLDNPAAGLGEMSIFDDGDVAQALKIWDAGDPLDPLGTMRMILMFALKVATINLDVHP